MIAGRINVELIRTHWLEILRIIASIRTGTVTASLIMRQLASYPRQNGVAAALREVGRIEPAILILTSCGCTMVLARRWVEAASRRDWWRPGKSQGEKQVLPGWEDQVDRDRCQLVEEIIARPELCPRGQPKFVADVADGVDREGQQVQAYQDGCKILLPVSEAVLKVVALVLQNVERLVLDLPPRPATGGKVDDRVGTDGQVGDEAVAVCRLAAGVDDLELEPVDRQRVLAVAQRHVMEPAVAMDETLLAAPDRLLDHRQVDAGEIVLDQRMRRRLADEDEMPARVQHGLAERLAGKQIVAEIDRVECRVALTVGGQPALGRHVLTILLRRPVLRDDEFRLQRDDLVVPGCHQRGRQHAVVIFRLARASDPGRAVWAMDLPRGVILRAVERDQHAPAEPAEHVEAAVDSPELIDGFSEYRMQQRRGGRIQHIPNVIVAGDFGDAEQAGAVGAAMPLLELPLMCQERRALHEKHREGRHSDVAHAIGRVHAQALVRKPVQAAPQ